MLPHCGFQLDLISSGSSSTNRAVGEDTSPRSKPVESDVRQVIDGGKASRGFDTLWLAQVFGG